MEEGPASTDACGMFLSTLSPSLSTPTPRHENSHNYSDAATSFVQHPPRDVRPGPVRATQGLLVAEKVSGRAER